MTATDKQNEISTEPVPAETARQRARRRALRAAQVVTIGLALAGCSKGHEATVITDDGSVVAIDGATDGASPDAAPVDSQVHNNRPDANEPDTAVADANTCSDDPFSPDNNTPECCEAIGGFWDDANQICAVAVPGPFVPPSMPA